MLLILIGRINRKIKPINIILNYLIFFLQELHRAGCAQLKIKIILSFMLQCKAFAGVIIFNHQIQTIKIMKHSALLIHPSTNNETPEKVSNIFESARLSESLPSINKPMSLERQSKFYDFVGPTEFKTKKFFPGLMRSTDGISHKHKQKNDSLHKKQQNEYQETTRNFSKLANSTINRETILSKLSQHEKIEATKERRNIDRYREYENYWQNQAFKMKRLINKKRPSLVQKNSGVIVEENREKEDIINNYIVHYWEMSLRNHNPILQQHIKGHKYGKLELQQLLQRTQGTKEVQSSIPKLPLQKLKKTKTRQLSLTGRSKSVSQSQSLTQRTSVVPFSHRDVLNQEEVYRINYEGDKKWLGTEGFF